MDAQTYPWGRVATAGVAALVLILAGVIWLGFANERLRQEVRAVAVSVKALPPAAPAVDVTGLAGQVKAVGEAVAALSAKVDALRGRDAAKALERLSGEVRALSAKVDGLVAAKAAPAKSGKTGKKSAASPSRSAPVEDGAQPRPFFGPGYPAWPGY
ncbi:conserved hypothetical protein [Solidesulfovibrio fructosivorans JJ]]|uniref:Uncharacterized protein n=1 Tax=Solidesulfovibrio fructosivorans JJ] TaxID=596151 RepID=E1JSM6_SOLFR|nr:hypothetical protein [Solidesulfovibrio fructosivorans]EFL52509.1 conserved hypothetical protein [Solidesulfovibrio fructosivorans JJ]]